jgi:xylan 1,4-beta-xylosidase
MKTLRLTLLAVGAAMLAPAQPVAIQVDAAKRTGPLKPVWSFFGHDEPNYTYMKDGKKLLSELAALSPVPVYMRVHSLLVTGDTEAALKWGSTNAYTEDASGKPVYDWTITDRIFDTYMERKMKPLVQIGFMPQALSSHPEPYRHHWKPGDNYNDIYTGWAYPPKDYNKWAELVYQWVTHCVQKYGKAEVESWLWEVWNEPNIGYWKGTPEEFHKLYDYSVDAVRRALPTAKVGGPDSTGPGGGNAATFLRNFLEHVVRGKNYVNGKTGAPLGLHELPRQRRSALRGRQRGDGDREAIERSLEGLRDHRIFPRTEEQADHHRRIRSRRLRRVLFARVPAECLS